MGSTATYHLPWPELPDVADGPDAFADLAKATETGLTTVRTAAATADTAIRTLIGSTGGEASMRAYVDSRDQDLIADYKARIKVVSDDLADVVADTNAVAMVRSREGDSPIGTADWKTVDMGSTVMSAGSGLSGATAGIGNTYSGVYLVCARASWGSNPSNVARRGVGMLFNSTNGTPSMISQDLRWAETGGVTSQEVNRVVALAANSHVYLCVYNGSSASVTLDAAYLTMARLGPL